MRNLRLDICYDGSRYKGWQRLGNGDNTIQGKIENTLSRILGEPVEITGSGRTDAGTHAMGQVANCHCLSAMPCEEILEQLRRYLPEDIGIYSVRNVSPRFHARLNAKKKTYRYRVWNSEEPCVFERRFVTIDARPLDIASMRIAGQHLLGEHDFSAFCAHKSQKKSTVRYIEKLDITRAGHEVVFTVTGNGFLHNMVRIIVGTLLQVGRGERDPESIPQLFGAARAEAGECTEAKGLCLMEVSY